MSSDSKFNFREYAKHLEPPNNDLNYVVENARNFVCEEFHNSKVYDKELVEYAIDNFIIAYEFFKKSYDLDRRNSGIDIEVKIDSKSRSSLPEKYDLSFTRSDVNHLFGLNVSSFNYDLPPLFHKWISSKGYYIKSNNLLDIIYEFFKENREAIIKYDTDPKNEKVTKFNWDKMSEKAFSFFKFRFIT